MNTEIDVAAEFLCLSFIVWGTHSQPNRAAMALALENNH